MKNLIFVFAFLISVSVFSQSILIEQPYCDLGGKIGHIFKISLNIDDQILTSDIDGPNRLYDVSEIENHTRRHINIHSSQSVFVIRFIEKSTTSENILKQIQEVYKSLNIIESDWKICYVSYDEDLNQPPPPPPPQQTKVIGIVENEEVEEDDDTPFMIVENMPALAQCKTMRGDERHQCTQMEIIKYVSKNTKYPPIAKDAGIQGTVFVYFVVGKDGKVKDVKVLREVDSRLDKEAKRVVESLPRFDPGSQRGKNVSVQYTIPVGFIIR